MRRGDSNVQLQKGKLERELLKATQHKDTMHYMQFALGIWSRDVCSLAVSMVNPLEHSLYFFLLLGALSLISHTIFFFHS